MLDRAQIRPDDTIVDVGTGQELLALGALDRIGPDGAVVILDRSADRLEQLRAVCNDSRVSYLVGSADVLPLPDGSVDVVLGRSLFVDCRDRNETARELFRVLRSGGRTSIFEPVESDGGLDRIFARVGFSDIDLDADAASGGLFLTGTKR